MDNLAHHGRAAIGRNVPYLSLSGESPSAEPFGVFRLQWAKKLVLLKRIDDWEEVLCLRIDRGTRSVIGL